MLSGVRNRIHLISVLAKDLQICRSLFSNDLSGDEAGGVTNTDLKAEPEDDVTDEDGSLSDHHFKEEEHSSPSDYGGGSIKRSFMNRQRKRSLNLPTVFLPTKLQEAIDVVASSEFKNAASW